MKIEIHFIEPEPHSVKVASLLSFISDRKIHAERPSVAPKESELGYEFLDLINVFIDHISDFSPLIIAILDWMKTNKSNKEVSIEVQLPDEKKIIIKGDDEKEVFDQVKKIIEDWKKDSDNLVKEE